MRVAFFHVRQDPVYALKMIESVRRNMDCEIVQNTDMETPAIDGCTVMRSKDEDNGNYMMWRMRGLSRLDGDVVSLDTDVVLQRDISCLFSLPFDAAFTWRDGPIPDGAGNDLSKLMPINSGVILYRNRDVWRECLEWCKKGDFGWYADQFAMAANWRKFDILRLHCDNFNYTPKSPDEDVSTRYAVHYKGKRKEWMLGH